MDLPVSKTSAGHSRNILTKHRLASEKHAPGKKIFFTGSLEK
jgi:hypothetical protein